MVKYGALSIESASRIRYDSLIFTLVSECQENTGANLEK